MRIRLHKDAASCAGRWKNTMVAIKVVEHTASDGNDATAEREALLATSLSHPNIVSTYKICTVHSSTGQTGGGASSGSPSGSNPHSGNHPSAGQAASGAEPGSGGQLNSAGRITGRPPLHPSTGSANRPPTSPHPMRGRRGEDGNPSPGRTGSTGVPPGGGSRRSKQGAVVDSAEQNAGHSGRSTGMQQPQARTYRISLACVLKLCSGAFSVDRHH